MEVSKEEKERERERGPLGSTEYDGLVNLLPQYIQSSTVHPILQELAALQPGDSYTCLGRHLIVREMEASIASAILLLLVMVQLLPTIKAVSATPGLPAPPPATFYGLPALRFPAHLEQLRADGGA